MFGGGSHGEYSTAGSAADGHDDNEGGGGPRDLDGLDDAELKAALRELVATLIDLMDPHYAEVVRRSEILGQSQAAIAQEMGLSERAVAARLSAGRRALLHLVSLTLQTPLEG